MNSDVATADKFVFDNVPHRCGIKSAVLEFAALARGLTVERMSTRTVLVWLNDRPIPFINMNGPHSSRIGKWLTGNKDKQRVIAHRRGLPSVDSRVFQGAQIEQASAYAKGLGWPVVVKPTRLSRGKGITTAIASEERFRTAWSTAIKAYRTGSRETPVLVERHVSGEDFRVFVVDDQVISATHRKRAHVVGNGESSIADLIEQKNEQRAQNPYLRDYPIPGDEAALNALRSAGLGVGYVPVSGEEVVLRSQSNLSAGGDSVDVTDSADSRFADMAREAVDTIPGLAYAGVDIITPDLSEFDQQTGAVVSEVEYSPAPLAHFPVAGESRNMADAILSHYVAAFGSV